MGPELLLPHRPPTTATDYKQLGQMQEDEGKANGKKEGGRRRDQGEGGRAASDPTSNPNLNPNPNPTLNPNPNPTLNPNPQPQP